MTLPEEPGVPVSVAVTLRRMLNLYANVKIEFAMIEVLKEGKVRTADLGDTATTSEMANAIVAHLKL